jgi:hypothetical protein
MNRKLCALFQTPFRPASPLSLLETIHDKINLLEQYLSSLPIANASLIIESKKLELFPFSPRRSQGMKEVR